MANTNPYIEEILNNYRSTLGKYHTAYYNHVLRVYNFTLLLQNFSDEEKDAIAIAAAFHDLGIWTNNTIDYLQPSNALAQQFLIDKGLGSHATLVADIINNHHKLSAFKGNKLVEAFRRADMADLTMGFINFGINRNEIKELYQQYPANDFHKFIASKVLSNMVMHPLRPLPMVKA